MSTPNAFDPVAMAARQRQNDRHAAEYLVRACQDNDVNAFYRAVDLIEETSEDGWRLALKKIALLEKVSEGIQSAFLQVFIESKTIRLFVGDDFLIINALRVLVPPYGGPAVRLFRGDRAAMRKRRLYGISWTTSLDIADSKFAQGLNRMSDGGSVVLETVAPPEAIIGSTASVGDYYGEAEYFVDRRRLGRVHVIRRYPQLSRGEWEDMVRKELAQAER
jgi:hypothetical protein